MLTATRVTLLVAGLCAMSACATVQRGGCEASDVPGTLVQLRHVADSVATALPRAADTASTVLRSQLADVVDRTARLDACGGLQTAAQLRDAGAIALQAAGAGAPSLEQAYVLARRAVVLDMGDRDAWAVLAAAWDQLQVRAHNAQWFATVITCEPGADGRCELETVDTSRVSDAQRVELGLRTLVQQQQRVDSLNRARKRA